ncbi:hypothetical protein Tco_0359159 [Tanacetum coccineum]
MVMTLLSQLLTHDEEIKEEEDSDLRVHTPSNYESTNDEGSDEEIQGANVEGEEMDVEETNEEDEVNELYRDVNVNLEGRDTEMTDAPRTIMFRLLLLPSHLFCLQQLFLHHLHLYHTSATKHHSYTINCLPASSLQDLPNFGSLFGFDHILKTLETDFSELKQTNQFADAVSLIPSIVDAYLANKMHEAVKIDVQLQSDRLKDEAPAENANFINKLDDNIKKIIKDQVKEQVKAQVFKICQKLRRLDKLILDTYGETVSFKRRRDEEDKDEEPSAGSNRGSKRRRTGKEPESTSAPKEKTSKTTGKSTEGSKSHQKSADESAQAEEPMQTAKDLEEPAHQEFETGVTEDPPDKETSQLPDCSLAKMEDPPGPTFKLMKGSCKSLVELEYFFEEVYKATTDQLDWNNPEEGDFNRLRIQDIEDMLLLLVQGKLTNLTVEERLAFNVSLRMFIRSVVIQRRVEDLQLGVKSYQKKLNLTKPDTYRSDLKQREAYTTYSNPRGFIYKNKDKKNRLMRIDKLHKFSDGTLNDVRTALDDRLKGIRMKYLPQTIWRQSDRDKAGAKI